MGTFSIGNRQKVSLPVRRSTLGTAIREQRNALLARLRGLPHEAWASPCPLPQPPRGVIRLDDPTRTVRDIVAHLLVVDGLALDRAPLRPWSGLTHLDSDGGWDRRRLEPFLQLAPDEMIATLERSGERVWRLLDATPNAVVGLSLARGASGSIGRQLGRQVLHEWVHERDIADAGRLEPRSRLPVPHPAVADAITDAVLQFLPSDVLPHADAADGVVRLDIKAGDGPRVQRWSADFGRRQYGSRVTADPDAVVCCDAATLAMLANGRADRLVLGDLIDVAGDRRMAAALLDAMRTPAGPIPCPVVEAPISA